jgi:hypothetical protein
MPTNNPRVNVTLKPSTAAVIRKLSELTQNSQSGLIAELLEANEDTFARLCTVLQAANEAKSALTEEMSSGLQLAQAKLETQLGLVLETMNDASAPILEAAEKVRRRAARSDGGGTRGAGGSSVDSGRRAVASTPMSNRGVRSIAKKPRSPVKTRGER